MMLWTVRPYSGVNDGNGSIVAFVDRALHVFTSLYHKDFDRIIEALDNGESIESIKKPLCYDEIALEDVVHVAREFNYRIYISYEQKGCRPTKFVDLDNQSNADSFLKAMRDSYGDTVSQRFEPLGWFKVFAGPTFLGILTILLTIAFATGDPSAHRGDGPSYVERSAKVQIFQKVVDTLGPQGCAAVGFGLFLVNGVWLYRRATNWPLREILEKSSTASEVERVPSIDCDDSLATSSTVY